MLSSSPAVSSSEAAAPSSSKTASSSSTKQEPSSSTAVHYTVSIYQSYYIEEKGEYGNPRFDTSVTREAGQPLYANISEKHDLMDLCTEVFRPTGGDGIYDFRAFFEDKRCRTAIGYKYYITSDVSIFYYCE